MRYPYFLLLSLLLCGFHFSCKTSKNVNLNATESTETDQSNYVYTLILEFKRNTPPDVSVYNIIKKEGYLKRGNENDVNHTHGYMAVFEFTDNTPRIKRTFEDPLNKVMEFVDANGNLGKKEVFLDNEVVPLRINYINTLSTLKIYEREGTEWNLIKTISLNN